MKDRFGVRKVFFIDSGFNVPMPALPHLKRYFNKVIASNKMLPKSQEAITWWEA